MEWRRGVVIGRGSSAAVYLATTSTGHLIAVKSAEISASTCLENEQRLLSRLCSPFIIKCFGSQITRENSQSIYNIFLEYVAGGTLSDLITNHGGSLDEDTIKFYALQLLNGLNYLHLEGIVHCDIKGQNLLIGDDGLTLKIADFGCAKRGGSASGFAGTPAYMAPEVARGEEQSFPVDIWAVGCTIVEMATGKNPWPEMEEPAAALYRVAYSDDLPEIPRWFSETGADFLSRCLRRDPKERCTAAELLRHPFLASCGGVGKCIKKSPTSVMDRRLWDAVEVSESSPENLWGSESPAGRIRGLIGDWPAWAEAEEEEWLMVRGRESEIETSLIVDEDSFLDNSFIRSIDVSDEDDSVSKTVILDDFINSDQLFSAIFLVFSSLSTAFILQDNCFNKKTESVITEGFGFRNKVKTSHVCVMNVGLRSSTPE